MTQRYKNWMVTRAEAYRIYTRLLNGLLPEPLTERELDVWAAILYTRHHLEDTSELLEREHRQLLTDYLGFKSIQHLNNYVMFLRRKGVLVGNRLRPNLDLPPDEDTYYFGFRLQINDQAHGVHDGTTTTSDTGEAAASDRTADRASAGPLLQVHAQQDGAGSAGEREDSWSGRHVRATNGYTSPYLAEDQPSAEDEDDPSE